MKHIRILFVLTVLSCIALHAQDTIVYKSVYAGGFLIVPKEVNWKLNRVFINDGGTYNIQISNTNFNNSYNGGDTIRLPMYVAEMELLSRKNMILYQLYFYELK